MLVAISMGSGPDHDSIRVAAVDVERIEPGSPEDLALQKRLTELQYRVTMQDATEPAFRNPYHDNSEPGLYLCIVSHEPLFSSKDKFDSRTGWPSFTRPLQESAVQEVPDHSLGMVRTEVRSRPGRSHLGHVFNDGPDPTGLRYCINSAALRFVPVKDFEQEGLEEYQEMFQ